VFHEVLRHEKAWVTVSDIAAGWYDDPENPSQYRYWDGHQWSDHRAPKHAPAQRGADGVVRASWDLGLKTIGPLLGIGALYMVALGIAAAMVVVGVLQSLDPGIVDILDRVTEPGFDPDANRADRAFVDSISFEPSALLWLSIGIAVLVILPATVIAFGMAMTLLANRHFGGSMTFGGSWSMTLRRFWRTLGVVLLWGLAYLVGVAVLLGVWVAAIQLPALLIIVIPATIGVFIYGYPYWWLAGAALFVGPSGRPPFRMLVDQVRPRWGAVAVPVLIINLVIFGISIGGSILGIIPIVGILVSLAASITQSILSYASAVVIWDTIGGEFDSDIVGAS